LNKQEFYRDNTYLPTIEGQAKMNYTILLDPGILPAPYNTIRAIPSSFFVDSGGKIKLGSTGMVSLDEIKAIFEAE